MKNTWDIEELIEYFTQVPPELELLGNKTGETRLGFALLLKHSWLIAPICLTLGKRASALHSCSSAVKGKTLHESGSSHHSHDR